jgi:hypothetical protein
VAEGAPLLREYVGKTCIKGSNPFDSAINTQEKAPQRGFFDWRAKPALKMLGMAMACAIAIAIAIATAADSG